jgi:hypothetical protein
LTLEEELKHKEGEATIGLYSLPFAWWMDEWMNADG